MIELRKRRIEDAIDQGGDTPAVPYAVLPEKKTGAAGAMMGSTHVYDMAAVWFHCCVWPRFGIIEYLIYVKQLVCEINCDGFLVPASENLHNVIIAPSVVHREFSCWWNKSRGEVTGLVYCFDLFSVLSHKLGDRMVISFSAFT